MGQKQSREFSTDDEPAQVWADDDIATSGVKITHEVMEQLAGRLPPISKIQAEELARRRAAAKAAEARAQEAVAALGVSLQHSRRVGSLLLAHEQEELAQVEKMADELLASEYCAPSGEPACQAEASDCLDCYRQHPGAPLECAAAVDAYSRCSRRAWASVVGAEL